MDELNVRRTMIVVHGMLEEDVRWKKCISVVHGPAGAGANVKIRI